MNRREFLLQKRRYLRRFPAPVLPPEGQMWSPCAGCGPEWIEDVEEWARRRLEEYDSLPQRIRNRIREGIHD